MKNNIIGRVMSLGHAGKKIMIYNSNKKLLTWRDTFNTIDFNNLPYSLNTPNMTSSHCPNLLDVNQASTKFNPIFIKPSIIGALNCNLYVKNFNDYKRKIPAYMK